MAIKTYNPTTPARRKMTSQDFDAITTKKPVKSLLIAKKQKSGRNNTGRITVRHRGGGAKRYIRKVNFNLPDGFVGKVEQIEYDPGRTARIARIKDSEGKLHYILAGGGMKVGQTITVGAKAEIAADNRLPLSEIPVGSVVYAIELQSGKGAQVIRSAGTRARLIAREGNYATVKMPSGEVRKFRVECMASVGAVGNEQHQNIKIGSAGRKRHMGIRPTVRGVVMNAVDHPHGGGDGGSHGPGKAPRTPWGQLTLGKRTRRRKSTDKMIVKSRHNAKRRR
jgi:large subunit ribosomal protein L2